MKLEVALLLASFWLSSEVWDSAITIFIIHILLIPILKLEYVLFTSFSFVHQQMPEIQQSNIFCFVFVWSMDQINIHDMLLELKYFCLPLILHWTCRRLSEIRYFCLWSMDQINLYPGYFTEWSTFVYLLNSIQPVEAWDSAIKYLVFVWSYWSVISDQWIKLIHIHVNSMLYLKLFCLPHIIPHYMYTDCTVLWSFCSYSSMFTFSILYATFILRPRLGQ